MTNAKELQRLLQTHVSAKDAATFTGYDERHLREMARAGKIPFKRAPTTLRGQVMIPRSELHKLKDRREAETRGRPKALDNVESL